MKKKDTIFVVIITLLLFGNLVFAFKYVQLERNNQKIQNVIEKNQKRQKVLNFGKLFVKEVLKAEGDIEFETRVELEKTIIDLQDETIMNQWNKFLSSETENDAQIEVKELLQLLFEKGGN